MNLNNAFLPVACFNFSVQVESCLLCFSKFIYQCVAQSHIYFCDDLKQHIYLYLWTVPAFPEPSTLIICKSLYKMFPHVSISSILPDICLLLPEFSSMGDSMSLELPWRVWTCQYAIFQQ